MRSLIPLTAVLLALGFAGCGGGDDTSSTTAGASGATGAQGAAGSSSEMTASEFIDASLPDEIKAVQQAAEANPDCADANTDAGSDFQVGVAIDAASADPDTPISEIVADNC
jgi:hypothetical protein